MVTRKNFRKSRPGRRRIGSSASSSRLPSRSRCWISSICWILYAYRKQGFKTAIDDFGSGYAGLNLLADFQPDLLKLDMELIRGIDQDSVRQVLVDGTVQMCRRLGVEVIAEGVETREELAALKGMGIQLFQGYLLARPGFEALPDVDLAL